MSGVILCSDLLFASKATGTASALGLAVRVARDVPGLLALCRAHPPTCVMIDLHQDGLDLGSLLESLKPFGARTVAFGSHVDAERLREARAAGCDVVLPKSAFTEQLPTHLAEWLS